MWSFTYQQKIPRKTGGIYIINDLRTNSLVLSAQQFPGTFQTLHPLIISA